MSIIMLPRQIYHGIDSIDLLSETLSNIGAKKVLIVTDKTMVRLGLINKVINKLNQINAEIKIYSDVEEEPSFDTADEIGSISLEFNPDVIIAIGGGSVIDAAKGGWVKYERPDYDLHNISPFEWIGLGKKTILIAIPTTSGTGSEATLGTVLSETMNGKRKIALGSYELVPNIVFLDPYFPLKMPKKLTLSTGLDVLAHALEAIVSVTSNYFTDALAEKSVELVFKTLSKVLTEPDNVNLRMDMHIAAFMAGVSFSNSGLGLCHAIGHAMGPKIPAPHGLTVGILLPYVIKFNYQSEKAKYKYNMLLKTLKVKIGISEPNLYKAVSKLYHEIGVPKLKDLIDKKKFQTIIDDVVDDALQDPDLAFNPIPVSDEDIKKVLHWTYNEILN